MTLCTIFFNMKDITWHKRLAFIQRSAVQYLRCESDSSSAMKSTVVVLLSMCVALVSFLETCISVFQLYVNEWTNLIKSLSELVAQLVRTQTPSLSLTERYRFQPPPTRCFLSVPFIFDCMWSIPYFDYIPQIRPIVYVDGQNKQKNSHCFIKSIYFNVYPLTSKFSFGAFENSSILIIQLY